MTFIIKSVTGHYNDRDYIDRWTVRNIRSFELLEEVYDYLNLDPEYDHDEGYYEEVWLTTTNGQRRFYGSDWNVDSHYTGPKSDDWAFIPF